MPDFKKHKIKIRFTGGIAGEHALPLYDGTTSIQGVGQALQIATHAFMTVEVVTRATALQRARFELRPARKGSFVFEVIAIIETYPAMSGIATAIGAPVFYDFLKTALKRASGDSDADPETAHLKRIYERKEPPPLMRPPADLDDLAEVLEGSLQRAHRPIDGHEGIEAIEVSTPRTQLLTFDSESKDWVNTRDEALGIEVFTGNVTRFNSLSRNGRAYIEQLGRVVPIKPGPEYDVQGLPWLTWSLHGSNAGLPNKLQVRARRVSSANGRVKRLLLVDSIPQPQD
ncbi:MAG: hypothetical protein AAF393_01635 [Pseudomonadota bacterium]